MQDSSMDSSPSTGTRGGAVVQALPVVLLSELRVAS
jgi:hypothetical protein